MSAIKDEVNGKPTEITYKDERFEIAPTSRWSLDALEAFEDGKTITFLRHLLGDDYARFRRVAHEVGDLESFFVAVQEAMGLGN